MDFRMTNLVAGRYLDWRMERHFNLSFIYSFIIQAIIEVLNVH